MNSENTAGPKYTPTIQEALRLQQAGQEQEAEALCRQILQSQPNHAEALHLLGVQALQRGQHGAAVGLIGRAVNVAPTAMMHGNLGAAMAGLGEQGGALANYRRALELDPGLVGVHHNLGALLEQRGQLEDAAASYRNALDTGARFCQLHHNLGSVLFKLGRQDEAQAQFHAASDLAPGSAESFILLGRLQKGAEQFDAALATFHQGLAVNPESATSHYDIGSVRRELRQPDEAIDCFRRALAIKPDFVEAHISLSYALRDRGGMADLEQAQAVCTHALSLAPRNHYAWSALASAEHELGRDMDALGCYRIALELKPDFQDASVNMGMLLLGMGRMEEGWAAYRARAAPGQKQLVRLPGLPFPEWQGEPLAGKSIMLWPEQGLGDEIQFCRYAAALKQMGARQVTLVCKQPLFGLLQTLTGVDSVLAMTGDLRFAPHDYWSLLLNLPQYCGGPQDGAAVPPYLAAEPARMAALAAQLAQLAPLADGAGSCGSSRNPHSPNNPDRQHSPDSPNSPGSPSFPDSPNSFDCPNSPDSSDNSGRPGIPGSPGSSAQAPNRLKVGLCWKGGPGFRSDAKRSPGLDAFKPLFNQASAIFYPLLPHTRDEFLAAAGQAAGDAGQAHDAASDAFEQTAALISLLDLVITCDTSVAHLAGALGKPVWLLLPYVCDWRWQAKREDSPWYPSATLFRQTQPGDWAGVMERVGQRLEGSAVSSHSPTDRLADASMQARHGGNLAPGDVCSQPLISAKC